MVLDLLGPSLEELFNFCNRKFSLKTVLLLADQLISRLEYIHSESLIHRDVKPANFVMGIGKRGNQLNVIGFGLAKTHKNPKTNLHIPYHEDKKFIGTALYASVNAHLGVGAYNPAMHTFNDQTDAFTEQSRRDDMESLGYIMLYFCRGSLPWQGLTAVTREEKYNLIMEKKSTTPIEVLCRGFPNEFVIYFTYIRNLRFDDKPDYFYLPNVFRDLFVREGFRYDYVFDWTVYTYHKNAQAQSQISCQEQQIQLNVGLQKSVDSKFPSHATLETEMAAKPAVSADRQLACPSNVRPGSPCEQKDHLAQQSTLELPQAIVWLRDPARYPDLILQLGSISIAQDQLAAEVKEIYAGLVQVEAKCMNIDAAQAADAKTQLGPEQWQALIALHRTLLYEHHDFLMATQHPTSAPALRCLAQKYSMPARIWRHGIHSFLEVLRQKRPQSQQYTLAFIYLAYQMMTLLFETVPAFHDICAELLGDLSRYRMAIEEEPAVHETWRKRAQYWYLMCHKKHPGLGRLSHHLGILERPCLTKAFLYAKHLLRSRHSLTL